jgi:hypothetical protein
MAHSIGGINTFDSLQHDVGFLTNGIGWGCPKSGSSKSKEGESANRKNKCSFRQKMFDLLHQCLSGNCVPENKS